MCDVALTWTELRTAGVVGIEHFTEARVRGRRTVNGQDVADALWDDMLGAWGERVVAKAGGCYWPERDGPDGGAADVGPWHVRTAWRTSDRLLVQANELIGEPFVLVVPLRLPTFRIVGWMLGRDAKRDEWWQELQRGRPCFVVPQSALRPWEERWML